MIAQALSVPKIADTIESLMHALAGPETFGTAYAKDVKLSMEGYGFFLIFDEKDK